MNKIANVQGWRAIVSWRQHPPSFPPSSQQTPTSQNNKLVGKASDHVQATFSEQCAGLLTQPRVFALLRTYLAF